MFIGLVVTILLTPGPTNTLLASAGIQAGVKQSLALLKLISATFILYLAFKLWITSTNDIKLDNPLITPKALFVATLLNPKALLFASAIFPHAAWEVLHVYFVHIAIFLSLITPIAFLWIAFGTVLISNKVTWLNQRNLQRTAAFILTFFAMPIGYSAISSF